MQSAEEAIENDYVNHHSDEWLLIHQQLSTTFNVQDSDNTSSRNHDETCHEIQEGAAYLCFQAAGFLTWRRVPDPPGNINTKFHLYTTKETVFPLSLHHLNDVDLNSNTPLKIIVHGWRRVSKRMMPDSFHFYLIF